MIENDRYSYIYTLYAQNNANSNSSYLQSAEELGL